MEILKEILTKESFISIFGIMFTVVYAMTAFMVLNRIKQRSVDRKKEFFETVINGLIEGTIENIDDLVNVYKGVTKLSSEDLTYRYGLNRWLREILAQLISRKIGKDLEIQIVKKTKQQISDFITLNEKNSPFSDLPDTERNILNDLSSFSSNGDNPSVERKIIELSSVIQTRYEAQKKLESQNKWSIPLAIVGLILTIVFGILSYL
jgi:hypothetical protein